MAEQNHQFRIELPEDWEDQTLHRFQGPEEGGVDHALTLQVDADPDPDELDEYARDRIVQMQESLSNVEVLKEEERDLPSGAPAVEAVVKWVPSEDRIIFQKLVFIDHGGVFYTFSANFSKRTRQTIGLVVDRIIESFTPPD
jgi:hypothetical protein